MVRLFRVAASFEEEQERLIPGGFAAGQYTVDARADFIPDLGPDFPGGLAKGPWVLVTQRYLGVGVVIEEGEVGPPGHPHRVARSQQNADDRLEALGPTAWVAEWSLRPVERSHTSAHLILVDDVSVLRAVVARIEGALSIGKGHRRLQCAPFYLHFELA